MAVLKPLKVIITNFPDPSGSVELEVPDFPADPSKGHHFVRLTSCIYIEEADFTMVSCLLCRYLQFVICK